MLSFVLLFSLYMFFFKQKTAYEMRISDWSSDVCSSDLNFNNAIALFKLLEQLPLTSIVSFLTVILIITFFVTSSDSASLVIDSLAAGGIANQIGRASCRDRVCQYV